MVTIQIGGDARPLGEVDDSWINQQINRRRADGSHVCVQVRVCESGVDVALSTPTCARGGSGGRPPNARESRIFELWNQRGLNQVDFTGGAVVAFLRQLVHLL